jgi:hypothetical protein
MQQRFFGGMSIVRQNQPFGFAFTETPRRNAIFRTVAGGRFRSIAIASRDFPEAASFLNWRSSEGPTASGPSHYFELFTFNPTSTRRRIASACLSLS